MQHIDLGGDWQVTQVGKSEPIPAHVPGCIHTDLLTAHLIEDPYYRDNENNVQWISEVDWVFARSFPVPADLLQHDRVLLRCHGLDTFATIILNGVTIAETDNMHRSWEFDVKAALVVGENTLEVRFASPLPYIRQRQAERPMLEMGHRSNETYGRAWVRKEPCNFGWDWGPVLTTCGIWRPIALVALNTARLHDVHVQQDHTVPGMVKLSVTADLDAVTETPLIASATVKYDDTVIDSCQASFAAGTAALQLTVTNPQLWWPNGMGEQPLYDVTVELQQDGVALDTQARRIGLRTLRLDRHADEWGESFQFVANGVPFFAKGGNWIPADAFMTRVTNEQYADLLQSMADANMNMVRVWGGGVFEDDVFYNLCDELGLCVWQDFLFACSTCPSFDEVYMASVQAEAEDNVRRLRHHPSIALWCGNNEIEQGKVGDSWNDHQMSWEDYGKLFDQLLPAVVRALDPGRDYWPGSPHSPLGDRENFNNPDCGDAHLWDVWHGRKPFEWYRTCTHRFNSEFGFQSFPEPKTVYGYTAPQDRNVTTYVMEHHQRSGIGNTVIMQYMLDWFRLPSSFDMTLWLSQILQGMAMKYAVEHWRRAMPRGMGTLYWQINDCWPVASWSSIDCHGRWKALHHMAKEFYAPLLVSGVEDLTTGLVEVHVTSDRLEACTGAVSWQLTDVTGVTLAQGTQEITAPARANTLATTLDLKPYLDEFGPRQLMLWLELSVDNAVVSTNFVSFARPKHLELDEPGITRAIVALADGSFQVTLEAQRPALWTWLELAETDARCSQNFFHLIPEKPVQVVVTPAVAMSEAQFTEQLQIRSLVDTYREVRVPVAAYYE